MKFRELASFFNKLEKTSSRIEITKILSELFKKSNADEIDKITYLTLGILAPSFTGIVFNLASKMMVRAVALAYNTDPKIVSEEFKKRGDLGDVVYSYSKHKGGDISVIAVYKTLYEIAVDQGEKSQERKINAIANLLIGLDPLSAKFVTRIPLGNLRLGFSDKTIIDALSWMEKGDKSGKAEIEAAYQVLPDVGRLASLVKEKGIKKIAKNVTPQVGIPVMPMLAQRLKSPDEMIEKMGKVAVEPKFDGLRVIIHIKPGVIKAFTRNLNEISNMFPELTKVGNYIKAKDAILDSEAVGLDPKTKKLVDFQHTMQRRRKHNIEALSKNIPLRFQVFDILYCDGINLMNEPYIKRREKLEKIISKNKFLVVDDKILTDDPEIIRKEHKRMLSAGLEGVIVKKTDGKYVPGRTGWRWVKMKEVEESVGKLSDTLDCIVMGYTRGQGKRMSFGIGQFLAGIRDGEVIKTITKVGTGLTDEQFRELARRLKKLEVRKKPKEYMVHRDLYPDYWVRPSLVIELAADEITVSPKHTAGLALRFPRLIKFRDDKSPNEATTLKEVKNLYNHQKS